MIIKLKDILRLAPDDERVRLMRFGADKEPMVECSVFGTAKAFRNLFPELAECRVASVCTVDDDLTIDLFLGEAVS